MNEKGCKKILYNKSTLLSLKAELVKKQEEVKEKKHTHQYQLENFKPPIAKPSDKHENLHKTKKSLKDNLKAIDVEELEACRKSKAALEKKATLYEHLSDSSGKSLLGSAFLVDFERKKQEEAHSPPIDHTFSGTEIQQDNFCDDNDNDWTEFTDCLGRTRKCLKSDLELYRSKDKDLMRAINKDYDTESQLDDSKSIEKPFLVQKTNDYLQSLRAKWEEKEKELLAKDQDIHYQDLLFDEARIHGVGYYSFSTDENERRKQMEELIKTRKQTLRAQEEAEKVRKKRDELIAARVAAARARQRARAGLPPEEPKEKEKDFTTCLLEFLTKKKTEADNKAKEEEKRIREEKERERQKLREAYVREWDIGKDGVSDGKVKKFREMSQEEYVEQQRNRRLNEFAPPKITTSNQSNDFFDEKGNRISHTSSTNTVSKSWSDVRPKAKTPPPPDISSDSKGLYFSTKSNTKYSNFVKSQDPVPIINEIDKNYESSHLSNEEVNRKMNEAYGVEIAAPATFEYYGPISKRAKFENPFQSDMGEAYDQGVKSLETKRRNIQLPNQYDFIS